MSSYYILILKRNLHLALTILTVIVCGVAVVESRAARSRAEEPLLIAIDNNGTRVIKRDDDPIFETEVVEFSKMFLSHLYNFTPSTFLRSVGQASAFMSIKLWTEKEAQLLSLSESVKKHAIELKGEVTSVSILTDGTYLAIINTTETTRMKSVSRKLEVRFEIARVPRTNQNPWGIEVSGYEEKLSN